MVIGTGRHSRLARWALVGWVCTTGCGDDVVAVTEGASSSGTGSGTDPGDTDTTPTTTVNPPTTEPATDSGMTLGTDSATTLPTTGDTSTSTGDTSTGDPITGTSTGDTTTDTSTGDTTTDTDTTTGVEVVGRSVSQTVNSGHLISSPNFRMVFTLGQPSANQSTTTSQNFKLRGGLVGANGSPP